MYVSILTKKQKVEKDLKKPYIVTMGQVNPNLYLWKLGMEVFYQITLKINQIILF